MRECGGAGACDLAVLHHAGQGEGECAARRLVGEPADLLPTDFGGEGEGVCAEQHLLRYEFKPRANRRAQLARVEQEGLRGEIRIDVRLGEERGRLARKGPAAVYEHEVGLAQSRIVKERFEQKGIAAVDVEV